jgi:hypothetical protein
MGHCYHHALSSAKKWGGTAQEYLPLHQWFDESKAITADFRHRALRHHAEGIFMLERFFGPTLILSTGRVVPVRLIGEQHVREDLGFIPSFADWVRCIRPQPWMGAPSRSTVTSIPSSPASHPGRPKVKRTGPALRSGRRCLAPPCSPVSVPAGWALDAWPAALRPVIPHVTLRRNPHNPIRCRTLRVRTPPSHADSRTPAHCRRQTGFQRGRGWP